MRKLAREATIFVLLGFALTVLSLFTKMAMDEADYAKQEAAKAVHADAIPPLPAGYTLTKTVHTVDVPLKSGTVLHIRECPDSEVKLKRDVLSEEQNNCRYFADWASQFGGSTTSLPLGNPAQVAIEKDYWDAYKKFGTHDLYTNAIVSAIGGVEWGIPAAFGIWIFYRLVRFAVKG
jgi:hypothetical protein